MLISDQGTMVRTRASEIAQVGRNTQGVTLMRVAAGERLIALEAIEVIEGEATGDDSATEATDDSPAPSAPN
jgi:DNA gyrase subunit A